LLIKIVGIANVDKQNEQNRTATFLSAKLGHVENLKTLLDSGANVNFEVHCNTSSSCLNGTDVIKQYNLQNFLHYQYISLFNHNMQRIQPNTVHMVKE
jgi:ankyrin repeat protein